MPRFFTLASSSTGNCSCFSSPEGSFLLDCGISASRVMARLSQNSVDPRSLQGVIITHEHCDHVKGLRPFLRRHPVPVYASGAVLKALAEGNCLPENTVTVPVCEQVPFPVGEISVTPFATSHDSAGPLCYRFSFGEREAAVITDTGFTDPAMLAAVRGVDLVLLESNYEPVLLQGGPYPYSLKQRISGPEGHLSNPQAAQTAAFLYENGTTRFVLGHLSQESNRPELAKRAVETAIAERGGRLGYDYQLAVAPVDDVLPVCIF